jgi:hypothetical protein
MEEIDLTPMLEMGFISSLSYLANKELLGRLDSAKSRANIVEIDLILDEIERRVLTVPE